MARVINLWRGDVERGLVGLAVGGDDDVAVLLVQLGVGVAYLAIQQASKKWTMPIQNWKLALNRFIIEFGDRLNGHL